MASAVDVMVVDSAPDRCSKAARATVTPPSRWSCPKRSTTPHEVRGTGPGRERVALPPGPQGRIQQHTVEQFGDFAPMVQILDAPVPQSVDQLGGCLQAHRHLSARARDRSAQDLVSSSTFSRCSRRHADVGAHLTSSGLPDGYTVRPGRYTKYWARLSGAPWTLQLWTSL